MVSQNNSNKYKKGTVKQWYMEDLTSVVVATDTWEGSCV